MTTTKTWKKKRQKKKTKAWQRADGSWWERDPVTNKIVPYKPKETDMDQPIKLRSDKINEIEQKLEEEDLDQDERMQLELELARINAYN